MWKYFLPIVLAGLSLCSCSKEMVMEEVPGGSGSGMDTIRISLKFLDGAFDSTKAVVQLNESLVDNVNMYIVNKEGGVVSHNYINSQQLKSYGFNDNFVLYTNHEYKVYVVLNWGEALVVNSEEQILNLKYTLSNINDIAMGSGGVIFTGMCDFMELYNGMTLEIPVKRIVSKVSLVCDFSGLSSGVDLKVKSVSLKNVPKDVVLFGSNVASSVINGEMRNSDQLLAGLSTTGISFYTLENIQGDVSGATSNKQKATMLGSRRNTATYIEVVCDLLTDLKRGDITYRFYLGTAHNNANIFRNTTQVINVAFKGNASLNENSVSVDNSNLKDRVTDLLLDASLINFKGRWGDTHQCKATIYPSTAGDKRVTWSCSSQHVATIDQDGIVTFLMSGICTITATSVDKPSISASCILNVDLR